MTALLSTSYDFFSCTKEMTIALKLTMTSFCHTFVAAKEELTSSENGRNDISGTLW